MIQYYCSITQRAKDAPILHIISTSVNTDSQVSQKSAQNPKLETKAGLILYQIHVIYAYKYTDKYIDKCVHTLNSIFKITKYRSISYTRS